MDTNKIAPAAPIDRDSVLEEAAQACEAKHAVSESDIMPYFDSAYNMALAHCAKTIRTLRPAAPLAVPLPADQSEQAAQSPVKFYEADVENIELWLAQVLDEAEFNNNELVTVNRAKLRTIAENVLIAAKAMLATPLPLPAGPSEQAHADVILALIAHGELSWTSRRDNNDEPFSSNAHERAHLAGLIREVAPATPSTKGST